jgi:hypothetical protein
MVHENLTSFWRRAAEKELSSTMNRYGLTDRMIARMDPEDELKQGRPPEVS